MPALQSNPFLPSEPQFTRRGGCLHSQPNPRRPRNLRFLFSPREKLQTVCAILRAKTAICGNLRPLFFPQSVAATGP